MRTRSPKGKEKYYVFRISVIEGRAEKYDNIWRKIEILESHSLYQFANAITESFDFYFDHPFGFYSNIKGHYFESKVQYDLFTDLDDIEPTGAKSVKKTKIRNAFNKTGDKMLFLFDYGDDWHFLIELLEIKKPNPKKKYPLTIDSSSKLLEQYPKTDDFDEDILEDDPAYDETERYEEEISEMLEKLNSIPPEELEDMIAKFEGKGMSGQIVAFDDSNADEAGPLIEYVQFHEHLKEDEYQNLSNKQIKKHSANLNDSKTNLFEKKKIIMILGHSGEVEAHKVLKKYLEIAEEELTFWTEQALGECKMFLESNLLDRPMIEFKKFNDEE